MFGKTKELEEIISKYSDKFIDYIDNQNDENVLNKAFTEITILRIKLDKKDSFLSNLKDHFKRQEKIEKKILIKLQFEDVVSVSVFRKYSENEYELIDEVMKKILPTQKEKNEWVKFWDDVFSNFDKITGRKK